MSKGSYTADEILCLIGKMVKDTVCIKYLQALLMHPNQPFNPIVLRHATDLESVSNEMEYAVIHNKYEHIRCANPNGRYPKVDSKTVAECMKYLTYLKAKIDECTAGSDYALVDDLMTERQHVTDYLHHSLDKNGKPYSFKTMRENDYRCVSRALKLLMNNVRKHDSDLADYLKANLVMQGSFMWRE